MANQPIFIAIINDDLSTIINLIESGNSPNAVSNQNESLLYFACAFARFDIVKHLVQSGAHLNAKDDHGQTPLHIVICNSTERTADIVVQIAKYLISNGADIDAIDAAGNTAIMCAMMYSRLDIAKCLIESGANTQITKNIKGVDYTVIEMAEAYGFTELVEFMLEYENVPTKGVHC